jgi:hypothetical protein
MTANGTMTATNELSDIKTQFYAIMEPYSTVYANYKVNPNLPSAADAYNQMEANLVSLYRRMFTFQAGVENELGQHEDTVNDLTNENSKLNVMLARNDGSLDSKYMLMTTPKAVVQESFVTVTGSLGDPVATPSPNQISLVSEARSIEKTAYMYSIGRIIYLSLGILIISYFVFQTVSDPNSTILADAKSTADQLKNNITEKAESMNVANTATTVTNAF